MRNLKKFLAVVVAIAVMLTAMVPAFAADATATASTISTDAQSCKTLKVLVGGSDGVTSEYLALGTQRIQAAVLLLRLMGKEAEARAYTATTANFKDVAQVGGDNVNLMAYLKANPQYGFGGYTNGNFGVKDPISAQQFYKVLLVVQGYEITAANYGDTLKTASANGMTKIASITKLTNDNVATALVEGLKAKVKDGSKTLVEKLIADKVVTAADAQAANVMPVLAKPTSVTVAGAGAKKLSVKFNGAVPDTTKMKLVVKRDGSLVNIATTTWNDAKTEATLVPSYNLLSGKYVATSTYDADAALTSAEVQIDASKVTKISFPSKNAVISTANDATLSNSAIRVNVKIENQYGEDITNTITASDISGVTSSKGSWANALVGTTTSWDKDTGALIIKDTAAYTVGNPVVITFVHSSGAVGSDTLTIAQSADIASIEIGDITTEDTTLVGKALNVAKFSDPTTAAKYYLPLTVKDQYGNVLKVADLADKMTVISSNVSILKPKVSGLLNRPVASDYLADKTAAKLPALTFVQTNATSTNGTVVITVVAPNGKSVNKTFTINENGVIKTLTIEQPPIVKKNDDTALTFTAVDQYNNPLVSKSELNPTSTIDTYAGDVTFADNTKVSVTNGQIKYNVDYVNNNKVLLYVKATSDSNAVLTVVTSKGGVQNLSLPVSAAKVPSSIAGVKSDYKTAYQKGLVFNLTTSNIQLKDQYGDNIDLPAGYNIAVAASDGTYDTVVTTLGAVSTLSTSAVQTTFQAINKGSEVVKLTLKKSDGTTVDEATVAFESVDLADITSFAIDDLKKLYTGTTSAVDPTHIVTYTVYGLKGTTKVAIDQTIIKGASVSVADADATSTVGSIRVTATGGALKTDGADKTAKLNVVVEGNTMVTVTKDVVYNDAARVPTKIEIRNGSDVAITDAAKSYAEAKLNAHNLYTKPATDDEFYFYVEDQYGVQMNTGLQFVVTNVTNADPLTTAPVVSITGAQKDTLSVSNTAAADNFVLTAISSNGTVKTIKIVIK